MYTFLALAGTIPFLFSAFVLTAGFNPLFWGSIEVFLTSYTLIIGAFMAGVHWGHHLDKAPKQLAIFSNLIALSFWFAYLLLPFKFFLYAAILLFLFLLLIDRSLLEKQIIDMKYFYTRCAASLIVVLSLLISAIKYE